MKGFSENKEITSNVCLLGPETSKKKHQLVFVVLAPLFVPILENAALSREIVVFDSIFYY